ncbi:NACHT, LRR and PYD domains-containing protein 12 isoform X3 [Oryzias melastigma]|uniref:NACHT, LRR and PYD domains-containing protein 12 isoform X3 n=1 Tax=Oryzias melastigma TaxID=30732 RepID=UPI000CF8020D|nr:NACHT, LRR and PYD domains-containing protein 12 isoform X3 [Oryzias melastigma]
MKEADEEEDEAGSSFMVKKIRTFPDKAAGGLDIFGLSSSESALSAASSCVSVRSDLSKDLPMNFRAPSGPPEPITGYAGSSCESVRSDLSKDLPINFREAPRPSARQQLRQRGQYAGSSCESVRSDLSKDLPLTFKETPGPSERQKLRQRGQYAGPSCESVRSDLSKDLPINFREAPGPSDCESVRSDLSKDLPLNFREAPRPSARQLLRQRGQSAGPSCESVRSDLSKDLPINFREAPELLELPLCVDRHQLLRQRGQSAGPSCESVRSDLSKDLPINFRETPGSSERRSEGPSCESVRSDLSKDLPINFKEPPRPSEEKDEEKLSCCALCQEVLEDPVSISCGHWFCRQCITSYWSQFTPSSGLLSCPQCDERSKNTDTGLPELLDEHQISLRRRFEQAVEGTEEGESRTLLNRIYTELYITEGLREEVHTHHEVGQLETAYKASRLRDAPIKNKDILKALPGQHASIRVVLTSGVAGAGKSFSVQKFILDWAEGLENQDIHAVVPLSFREVNLIGDEQHSLLSLIQLFHPTFQKIPTEQLELCKMLLVFDGLDESRLFLDFNNSQVVSDVTQKTSISLLLTNLIQGHLLPSALVWITSRPAAASQIPPSCVDRLTEVRGFNDAQKEEYFRRRFTDENMSNRILSHIRNSRSLYIMCEVPVFCWITTVVLEHMLTTEHRGELPSTLTDMYSHFLVVQTKRKKKYQQEHEVGPQELVEGDKEVLLKLGNLAFDNLEKGNIMFYQEDLEKCSLDVIEASVYSGVCTEIFRRECEIFQKPVYSFVHLSIQEFLAAVYMFHCYINRNNEVIEGFLKHQINSPTVDEFLIRVLEKSLQSRTGHLDLFVRFLHGLSVESNQKILGSLLGRTNKKQKNVQAVIQRMKKITIKMSPDRGINIFHCLMEMQDRLVHREIQEFLKSENRSEKKLSDIHCSALAYMLQMSDEVLDELDLNRYNATPDGRRRLIPAVRNCRKAWLSDCGLSETHLEVVASALKSNLGHLAELDLSKNKVQDSGVMALSAGLERPNCKLETLRLVGCSLSGLSCVTLRSALKSNPSHLTELDLSKNKLQDAGVEQLCGFLQSPDCLLKTLRLMDCSLSGLSCSSLSLALKSNPSHLTKLDLSNNTLQDVGVEHLCRFLQSPDCGLKTLRLVGCELSEISCAVLGSALRSNPFHLEDLDLGCNKLQDSGVEQLAGFLQSPDCRLKALRLDICSVSESGCAALVSALMINPSHLMELDLSYNKNLKDAGLQHLCGYLQNSGCRLKKLGMIECELSNISCAALDTALRFNPIYLEELDLTLNSLKDSGVEQLVGFLQNPDCGLTTLKLVLCHMSERGCAALASALKSNPSQLENLYLGHNLIEDPGLQHLCGFLENSSCTLQTLSLESCGLTEVSCTALLSALKSNPSHLALLDLSRNDLKASQVQKLEDLVKSPNYKLETLRWKV